MTSNALKFSLVTTLLFGMAFSARAQTPAPVPAQATSAKAAPSLPAAAPAGSASPASPTVTPRKPSVPAPDWLTKEVGKPIRLQGEGTLRIIGFAIYNARLWVPGSGFTYDNDFALDITYRQRTDKQGLVLATVPELGRFMTTNSAKLDAWTNDLKRVYPDIEVGDRFIAIWRKDQNATRFCHNDKPTGDIMGADFAKAFFAIWLDPLTRRPELRRALLSE
ncbi:MAG: chalcone isomerase family protein [Rhodocyclaceae bacterium]|jgi:hypothetical protein|nr:chalcone isomerase family protein [Rhodocyclaceae bacterium]MCA3038056.1 chalcone isomerase family protein [Rhodocyclaceae bacterium]MCA3040142.1 chalcone isomerase family protein [Rhodocyclaceae bacterium]MCA3055412.1 chalcone isomerase family protein [Rhodocyclaceae bacterium]MCA3064671.1 chalcone isomerase family protein [Rhodocyclaceae bacterium]